MSLVNHGTIAACLAATIAFTTAACSGDDNNHSATDASTSDAATDKDTGNVDGTTPTHECESTGAVDMVGTWAVLAKYSISLKGQAGGAAGMCPVDQVSTATMLMVADISAGATNGEYAVSAMTCQLDLPQVSAMAGDCTPDGNKLNVEIQIPPALTESWALVDPSTGKLTLTNDQVKFDWLKFQWGTRNASLPTWDSGRDGCGVAVTDLGNTTRCEDKCVTACGDLVDDDKDTYPGITVHLCGLTQNDRDTGVACRASEPATAGVTMQGAARMALETSVKLNGQAASSCRGAGTFASETQYTVVGTDTFLSGSRIGTASVQKSLPLFNGVEKDSQWRMLRVDGRHGAANWELPSDAARRCALVRSKINELQ